MAAAKMETAAQAYRRRKAELEAKESLHDVTCSTCDTVWKCRKSDLTFWVTSGIMPTQLAGAFMKLAKAGKLNETDLLATLDVDQMMHSLEFISKVVRYTAVDPKIVENPTADTEIGFDDVMPCCYGTLRDWQLKGGDEAARLENFPQE